MGAISKPTIIKLAFKGFFTAIIICALFYYVDLDGLHNTFSRLSFFSFIASTALVVLIVFINNVRWRVLIYSSASHERRSERPQSWWRDLLTNWAAAFLNILVPGGFGGEIFRGFDLYRSNTNVARSVGLPLMDRFFGLGTLLLMGGVSLNYTDEHLLGSSPWIKSILISSLIFVSIVTIIGTASIVLIENKSEDHLISRLRDNSKSIVRLFLYSITLSSMGNIALFLSSYFIIKGLSVSVDMYLLFFTMSVATAISSLPITIGGLGVRESVFAGILATAGISAADSVAASLLWFVSATLATLPGVFVIISRFRKQKS